MRIYWFFTWRNLNPYSPKVNFVNVYSLFRNYLPLEKGGALHLNKLESPSPKDALCQVWLKLDQWFWRRFLNFLNVNSVFLNYLPLERAGPFVWTILNPLHPKMLCTMFGWNWLSGSGEEPLKNQRTLNLTVYHRLLHSPLWLAESAPRINSFQIIHNSNCLTALVIVYLRNKARVIVFVAE